MIYNLSRSILGAGAFVGVGLALQPIWAEPSLHALALQGGEMIIRGGVSVAFALAGAYGIHRIKAWAGERPILPTPSQVYSVTQDMGPALAGEVALAQAQARATQEDDIARQIQLAIIRFCIIGESRRSFAYERMKQNCDRPTWDLIKGYLADNHILRIGSGRRATWFREGWASPRVRVALKRGDIPPLPVQVPPVVVWSDYRQAMQTSKHTNTLAYGKG